MALSFLLIIPCCLGAFLVIWGGVAFVQDKKYFGSAPKDIQEAVIPRTKERFKGAHALGWAVTIVAVLMILAALIFAVWDGVHKHFGYWQFFLRFLTMLDGYKTWDIIFLDWFLLTKSHFYQRYYPETEGCESFTHMGFNTKSQLLKLFIIVPLVSLGLAGICMLF